MIDRSLTHSVLCPNNQLSRTTGGATGATQEDPGAPSFQSIKRSTKTRVRGECSEQFSCFLPQFLLLSLVQPPSDSEHDNARNKASTKALNATGATNGTGPGGPRARPVSAASNRSRGGANAESGRRSSAGGEDRAPFRPSGKPTTVYKYPEYLSDPYDDRKRREAQTCGRGLPPVPKPNT
jgi:hypothetical protein